MAILQLPFPLLHHVHPATILILVPALVLLVHFIPWLVDPHGLRSFPGPRLARFSDLWLGRVAKHGHRSQVVHQMHEKYGKLRHFTFRSSRTVCNISTTGTFVRIAPNHISISDPVALQIVYAHGNGSLKSNFYDAFVSITRGLFNTRDRVAHTRKRKIISHIFSQKSVLEFEPYVRDYVRSFIQQWDRLCAGGAKGLEGNDGEGGWRGRDGRTWLDCLPCRPSASF